MGKSIWDQYRGIYRGGCCGGATSPTSYSRFSMKKRYWLAEDSGPCCTDPVSGDLITGSIYHSGIPGLPEVDASTAAFLAPFCGVAGGTWSGGMLAYDAGAGDRCWLEGNIPGTEGISGLRLVGGGGATQAILTAGTWELSILLSTLSAPTPDPNLYGALLWQGTRADNPTCSKVFGTYNRVNGWANWPSLTIRFP